LRGFLRYHAVLTALLRDADIREQPRIYVEQTDTEPAENCAEAQVLAQAVNDRLPRAD